MSRFTWNETAIADALRPVVDELGRMPTRAELNERGLVKLWDAMRRRGGTDHWASRMGSGPPPPGAIRERAYFISLAAPEPDPVSHWFQAERELAAA